MGVSALKHEVQTDVARREYRSSRDVEVFNDAYFEEDRIQDLAQAFAAAEPFPHLVMDGLFEDAFLERVAGDFRLTREDDWLAHKDSRQFKFGTRAGSWMPPNAHTYFDAVNAGPFLRYLTRLTGVEALIADTHLVNGGMHQIPHSGRFALHIDNQIHPVTRLNTRLTMITYLNRDWKPEYGGALEMRRPGTSERGLVILPLFGRTVLFLNTPNSLHGHPDPVIGPKSIRRRSMATYYYTNGGPAVPAGPADNTAFEQVVNRSLGSNVRRIGKRLLPPVLLDAYSLVVRSLARSSIRLD